MSGFIINEFKIGDFVTWFAGNQINRHHGEIIGCIWENEVQIFHVKEGQPGEKNRKIWHLKDHEMWLGIPKSEDEVDFTRPSSGTPDWYDTTIDPNTYLAMTLEKRPNLDPYVAYCVGQINKYNSRIGLKEGTDDEVKIHYYATLMLEHIRKEKQ